MNFFSRFFLDLGLFLVFFGLAGGVLYGGVYTEESNYLPPNVLISEIRPSGGSGKSNEEYVELYNPRAEPMIIGSWEIYKMTKSASSTDKQLLFTFPSGTVLPSLSHLLVAHVDYTNVEADFRYTGQALSDDNTVVLTNEVGGIIDLVGYGLAKNVENKAADVPTTQLLSLERRPGGSLGNGQDTQNNYEDFFRIQSNPQNLASPITPAKIPTQPEMAENTSSTVSQPDQTVIPTSSAPIGEIGVPTSTLEVDISVSSTPSLIPTTTVQVINTTPGSGVPSSTPTYTVGEIVINEVYSAPESGQNEFIELLNKSDHSINLSGWYLTEGSNAKTTLSGELLPGNYLVVEKPKGSLNNAGDIVNLFAPNQWVVDQLAYGDWNDGNVADNAVLAGIGTSLVRIPEMHGSDQEEFKVSTLITKGAANVYTPVVVENDEEVEEEPIITSTNVSTTTKVSIVKPGPIYPRVIYLAKGKVGVSMIFDARQSSGGQGVKQYIWEMDDGSILRGDVVEHVFTAPDTYSVSVSVSDETGTEKHKTVKVVIEEDEVVTTESKEKVEKTVKTAAVKKTDNTVFVSLNAFTTVKTNTLVRLRGVLGGVITTKSNPEFYLLAENSTGGSAAGILVKTKSTSLDARLGDVLELTGKYLTNNTGNYVQFAATDEVSIISSGENMIPLSSPIKEIKQLTGGFVQITGEVVEKKSAYIVVSDETGEIKINNISNDSLKVNDQIIVTGFLIKTKDGIEVKISGPGDVKPKKIVNVSVPTEQVSSRTRPINTFIVIGILVLVALIYGIKKLWSIHKNKILEETEI